jgi:hypothetical protein
MNNQEIQHQHASPELLLETTKLKRLELEQKARRQERDAEKAAEEIRQTKFAQNLRRQLASVGIDFYPEDDELRQMIEVKSKAQFLIQNDGQFSVEIDGKQVDFKELIQQFAVGHQFLVADRDTLKRLVPETPIKSKADLRSPQETSDYIDKFGLRSYESLPMRHVPDAKLETITADQYRQMSTTQKVNLGLDEYAIGFLLRHGTLAGYEKK